MKANFQFRNEIVFPVVADHISRVEPGQYFPHQKLVESVMDDPRIKNHIKELRKAGYKGTDKYKVNQMVTWFSSNFTMDHDDYQMDQYRRQFNRKKIGRAWAYTTKGKV